MRQLRLLDNFVDWLIERKIIYIFYAVGIALFLLPWTKQFALLLTFPFLFLNAAVLMVVAYSERNFRYLAGFALIALLGFWLEVLGVNFGVIFGEYLYSGVLGPKIFDTVILIGFLWSVLVCGVFFTLFKNSVVSKHDWREYLLTAMTLVGLDVFLEQLAISNGFWSWAQGMPPWQNYWGWLFTSLLGVLVIKLLKIEISDKSRLIHRQLLFALIIFVIVISWSDFILPLQELPLYKLLVSL